MALPPLDRRTFLVLGGTLLAGCTGNTKTAPTTPGSGAGRTTDGGSTSPAPPTGSANPRLRLPKVLRWHPSANDITPTAKLTGARAIERLGNTGNRALQVMEAQYGGILSSAASVLIVCSSWRLVQGEVVAGGHTYDVRLSRGALGWRVTAIHPSAPGARAQTLTRSARRVLASDRIDLPPAARADVASGQVQDSTLAAMFRLSRTYRIGVSVVRSGHPRYVFGTDRLSDHPFGRAFDTWSINGRAVIDPGTPESLVTDYMRAAADVGSYNVGGPYLVGAAPQYFSDSTHHDHVHAGFLP